MGVLLLRSCELRRTQRVQYRISTIIQVSCDTYRRFNSVLVRGTERFSFELFHEQLPLPVPCYDLLPVTELTVGRALRELRVLPAPLS